MAIDERRPEQEAPQGSGPVALQSAVRDPGSAIEDGCPYHRWREDFPIQWENDHYVTRRELTKFLTLGSALLVGANGVIAWLGHVPLPEWREVRIAAATDVPRGGSFLFRYPADDDPCILVRDTNGGLQAYSQLCTHLSCAVVYRPDREILFCPCHQGAFNAQSGVPVAGPPTRRLPRIRVEERSDGIYALGVEV
jgi:nitrite reductase/ring-hydroxylating ferredoxin subunit